VYLAFGIGQYDDYYYYIPC